MKDLESASSYLEFGSGSSTLAAVAAGTSVVTVESDPDFLNALELRCRNRDTPVDFLHVDIGRTGPWGVPLRKAWFWRQITQWNEYCLAPWQRVGADYRADLVLVDGRFRVACALAVVTRQADSRWRLLLDDYAERPEYRIVERFADLKEMRGRMAVFEPKAEADLETAEQTRKEYVRDWR